MNNETAFEGPEETASPPEIKQDVRRQHVSRILKTRLDEASRYEELSSSRETFQEQRAIWTKAGRTPGLRQDEQFTLAGAQHAGRDAMQVKLQR